jgi:carboxyl-terminal processing protease
MNFISKILICIILFGFAYQSQASTTTRWEAFIFFANQYKQDLPDTYQYINLHYLNIVENSEIEDALQKLVYLDLIKNKAIDIGVNTPISTQQILAMEKLLVPKKIEKKSTTVTIKSSLQGTAKLWEKEKILTDVYKTISSWHYDRAIFKENQLTQWAIKGIAQAAWDKYTSYFPPVESDSFFESLDWEYEWIGSYVDMQTPGQLIIISPIVWSPSEAAGIKWGDRVTHVDDNEITEVSSLREVISWIKGPSGTQVKLTIIREWESSPIEIYVIRAKIIIKDVEHKKIDRNTYYIQIKNFWESVDSEFKWALEAILKEKNINKIIFDVRNNPGGYLGEVSTMLSYFIDQGDSTAIIDYGKREIKYSSQGFDLIDFSKYELVFLQNGWSASASEIMVWTLKDYYPEATIIGEQSFWKWSVQSLKTYSDGSTLKYTSAKWFTGNTKQGIDGVWITPDIELEFDVKRWDTFKKDNQLEKAISY